MSGWSEWRRTGDSLVPSSSLNCLFDLHHFDPYLTTWTSRLSTKVGLPTERGLHVDLQHDELSGAPASFARWTLPVIDLGMNIGTRVDETGTLFRDGGAFWLRRDLGGGYRLDLRRTPVDEVEKRVRVIGTFIGDDTIDVDGVALASSGSVPLGPTAELHGGIGQQGKCQGRARAEPAPLRQDARRPLRFLDRQERDRQAQAVPLPALIIF
jgi:hypothetical protein